MGNNKPIVPVFKVTGYSGISWRSDHYSTINEFFTDTQYVEGLREISLDGERFYSMERIEELIELGLQYEYAIESLAVENDDEQRN